MRRSLPLAGAALLLALGAGAVSVRRASEQLVVLEACEALRAGDLATALAKTRGRTGPDETGRAAAECRCAALIASGRGAECSALLEQILSSPEADGWAPEPTLATHLIQMRREEGRGLEAAALARRAAHAHPTSPELFYLELVTRGAVEDEDDVLDELAARLPGAGPEAARMRITLANRHLLRGDAAGALAALGPEPATDAGPVLGRWFETHGMARAAAGDLAGVRATYDRWRSLGGEERELAARYALTLSIGKLADPEAPTLELLRGSLAREPDDPALVEALHVRLILDLVNAGENREALEVFDRARERFALEGLSREELERSAAHARRARSSRPGPPGRLRFALEKAPRGSLLLVSPESEAPVDAGWETLPVPRGGRLVAKRRPGVAPVRWVLRDGRGRTLASGSTSPRAGATVDVTVTPGKPLEPLRFAPARRPGDGRRRVALVLLDCADWRLVQYLRARGELPVLDSLLSRGWSAVLESDPPLTAAALEALVSPRRESESFVGLMHRYGTELAGLSSVGDNPFDGLAWLLPEAPDLFRTVGAGEQSAANLLFAHGSLRAGRHGEVSGPHGARRRVRIGTSERDLSLEERTRFPGLAGASRERDAIHLRTIAAELDALEELLRDAGIDLVALRVEPLDILTHAHFADTARDGQDDGRGLLYSLYRYLDARLGRLDDQLDADDALVVLSDHGIRTAMEHSRFALFVAAGEGIPRGRAPGSPDLRGVPRLVAGLLDIDTDWPDTGVAPWLSSLARGPLAGNGSTPHPASARP